MPLGLLNMVGRLKGTKTNMPGSWHFDSPFLLGFERVAQSLERMSTAQQDGYPPYNVERLGHRQLRITLAVAGFNISDLSVTVQNRQLMIRGQQSGAEAREFLHKGIATREFQRVFLLAEDVVVDGAELADGLLSLTVSQPEPESTVQTIEIKNGDADL